MSTFEWSIEAIEAADEAYRRHATGRRWPYGWQAKAILNAAVEVQPVVDAAKLAECQGLLDWCRELNQELQKRVAVPPCPTCEGRGHRRDNRWGDDEYHPCPDCGGSGHDPRHLKADRQSDTCPKTNKECGRDRAVCNDVIGCEMTRDTRRNEASSSPIERSTHPMPCPRCPVRAELEAERDSYREAIEQALGLIETASSRSRILQARDALRAAAER
jgi:hypothetical protein